MGDHLNLDETTKLAVEIVVAFLGPGQRSIEPDLLPDLVKRVRSALSGEFDLRPIEARAAVAPSALKDLETQPREAAPDAQPDLKPAVPIAESVHPDYLISLEDGGRYRSLRRHLMAKHGLTPDEYRARWGLPKAYPMVAPNYARARSEVAKRIGLGKPQRRPSQDPPGRAKRGSSPKRAGRSRTHRKLNSV